MAYTVQKLHAMLAAVEIELYRKVGHTVYWLEQLSIRHAVHVKACSRWNASVTLGANSSYDCGQIASNTSTAGAAKPNFGGPQCA
jgi:plastocyanin